MLWGFGVGEEFYKWFNMNLPIRWYTGTTHSLDILHIDKFINEDNTHGYTPRTRGFYQ